MEIKSHLSPTDEYLDVLMPGRQRTFLIGDLKLKSRTWNSRSVNRKVNRLEKYVDSKLDTSLIRTLENTFYSGDYLPDILDSTVMKANQCQLGIYTVKYAS